MSVSVMKMRDEKPSLWEEAIERRGQYAFWYSSMACSCIADNGRVNPNCPKCYGRGYIYKPVTEARRIITGVATGKKTIDISARDIQIGSINHLYTGVSTEVDIASFTSTSFTTETKMTKGIKWTLDFQRSYEFTYSGTASYIGHRVIEVPITIWNNQNTFYGQIVSVTSAHNETKDEDIVVDKFWGNKILSSSIIDEDDEITIVCEYIKPLKFLIQAINPKMKLETNLIFQNSDAQMSFPGTYNIGRGDVIVLQLAEMKDTIVGYNSGDTYIFPYQSISKILHIEDKYGPITDYTLVNDNEISWGARKPQRFSCAFTYHPAFSVLDDLPTVRYSENKVWPQRVFLKKFSTFTHSSKVLSIETERPSVDEGLLDDPHDLDEQGGLI